MGSIYRMPFLIVDDAVGFVKGLKARKICTYAAHLHGVHSYREEDYTKGTAFLIGNEGNGLTDAMAEAAECLIRIPMEGKVESLSCMRHTASAHKRKSVTGFLTFLLTCRKPTRQNRYFELK